MLHAAADISRLWAEEDVKGELDSVYLVMR